MTNASAVSTQQPHVIMREGTAKVLGVFMVFVAVAMTGLAIHELWRILLRALILGADIYVFMMVLYYWTSRSYKDGVTIREFGRNLIWPWGYIKLMRSIRTNGLLHHGGSLNVPSHQDTSWKLCGQRLAFWGGVLVTLITSLVLPLLVMVHLFHLAVAMLWFIVAVWTVSDVFYFWANKVYREGVTAGEFMLTLFGGPVGLLHRTSSLTKRRRQLTAA